MPSRISCGVLPRASMPSVDAVACRAGSESAALMWLLRTLSVFGRHASLRGETIPAGHDVFGKTALLRGRNIAQQRIALLTGRRNDSDLIVRDHRLQTGIKIEPDVNIPSQHRCHKVGRCLVRNNGHVNTGYLF